MDFLRLSFTLQLQLAHIVLEAFDLEPQLIVFALEYSPHIALLLDIFRVLDDELILIDLELIPFSPQLNGLLLSLTKAPLGIVQVSSQLTTLIFVLVGIFDTQLQGLVIRDKLLQFLLMPPP